MGVVYVPGALQEKLEPVVMTGHLFHCEKKHGVCIKTIINV